MGVRLASTQESQLPHRRPPAPPPQVLPSGGGGPAWGPRPFLPSARGASAVPALPPLPPRSAGERPGVGGSTQAGPRVCEGPGYPPGRSAFALKLFAGVGQGKCRWEGAKQQFGVNQGQGKWGAQGPRDVRGGSDGGSHAPDPWSRFPAPGPSSPPPIVQSSAADPAWPGRGRGRGCLCLRRLCGLGDGWRGVRDSKPRRRTGLEWRESAGPGKGVFHK